MKILWRVGQSTLYDDNDHRSFNKRHSAFQNNWIKWQICLFIENKKMNWLMLLLSIYYWTRWNSGLTVSLYWHFGLFKIIVLSSCAASICLANLKEMRNQLEKQQQQITLLHTCIACRIPFGTVRTNANSSPYAWQDAISIWMHWWSSDHRMCTALGDYRYAIVDEWPNASCVWMFFRRHHTGKALDFHAISHGGDVHADEQNAVHKCGTWSSSRWNAWQCAWQAMILPGILCHNKHKWNSGGIRASIDGHCMWCVS